GRIIGRRLRCGRSWLDLGLLHFGLRLGLGRGLGFGLLHLGLLGLGLLLVLDLGFDLGFLRVGLLLILGLRLGFGFLHLGLVGFGLLLILGLGLGFLLSLGIVGRGGQDEHPARNQQGESRPLHPAAIPILSHGASSPGRSPARG